MCNFYLVYLLFTWGNFQFWYKCTKIAPKKNNKLFLKKQKKFGCES